ncbi:PTS lactose/cellobiose transporter subunit IIA, partial [Listeria monocytogenes]|uniref:PTS lactose/cellobiose transporter subunit IIA n=1 Tax=Listeria monocytogenes TaxID=1639 RepID=UPI002B2553C3
MDLEQTIMSLIVFGGNAKSDAMLAIDSAKKGDFAQADEQIAQAEQALLEAHHSQTKLIQGEARGEKTEVSLLLVHAQHPVNQAISLQNLSQEN